MADPMPPAGDFRYFRNSLDELSRELRDLQAASGTQSAQSVRNLRETIAALPIAAAETGSATGFGLSGGWVTYATVSIPFPPGKTKATVMALGTLAAADLTSGGLAVLEGRVVIAGSSGRSVPAAKDAGASVVNNIVTAAHARTITGGSGALTAQIQGNPSNPAAFPVMAGNLAQITIQVTFSG
ncbi:hypothetical protein [Mycetocola sp. JXN-3]|uniref:hypothetical protein n=1 Tax=Mycetocola sp. JXN-3 TaxID=2116510 RepID=UPI00165CEE66|nr:hypothetical protein [Mycetocola sp. JXN-3]